MWQFWQRELAARGWSSFAIDLRGHGRSAAVNLSETSMGDYAEDVRALMKELSQPPILIGWSMGGLVAMMIAESGLARACIGLAPSLPARSLDTSVTLNAREFGAEEYGIFSTSPDDQPQMKDLDRGERTVALASLGPESGLARDERRRGIVVEALACPLLIVTGTEDQQWPLDRYKDLWLPADYLSAGGATHWGLVLNRRALTFIIPSALAWLARITKERADQ